MASFAGILRRRPFYRLFAVDGFGIALILLLVTFFASFRTDKTLFSFSLLVSCIDSHRREERKQEQAQWKYKQDTLFIIHSASGIFF
jgi:hypothetical protein